MKLRYTNEKGVQTWAVIQERNIDTNDGVTFEATYKGVDIQITTEHGHGKAEKGLKRFDIVVLGKFGAIDCDTWQDLPNLRSAIMFALKGACLIKTRGNNTNPEIYEDEY